MPRARTPDSKFEIVKAALMVDPDLRVKDLQEVAGLKETTTYEMRKKILNDKSLKDDFESVRERKKEQFIDDAWNTVTRIHLKINEKLDSMTGEQLQKVNIRDLATSLGIIYDKRAVASGEPTNISENKSPTKELINVYEEKLTKLKEAVGS